MRLLIFVWVLSSAIAATAQDFNQQIQMQQQMSQDAMQASQQAANQAMQASQQAADQSMQAAQAAAQSTSAPPCSVCVDKPSFSIKPGNYSSSITVRMKDSTRGATIYYTTDGWTPTRLSNRYIGPITISSTINIQAVAITPNNQRSLVVFASYKLPGNQPPNTTATAANFTIPDTATLLRQRGTPVPLVFTAPVTSKGMQIGDKLPVVTAQDLVVNGALLAPKGTPVLATVTQVDAPTWSGIPGDLTFVIRSLTVGGQTMPLFGSETKEGQPAETARKFTFIPFVALVQGQAAEIPQGATLIAVLDNNTQLPRAQ